MTFARALRAILRQDPDVVMIGEIRDLETAQIAVQASLTGHLVLATLHTNDAPGAVTRLIDMGIEPFLLASTLLGRAGAAAGAQALPRLPVAAACPTRRARRGCRRARCATAPLPRRGLRRVQLDRLPGPHRHLRAAHRRRRDAPPRPRRRRGERDSREHGDRARHDEPARRRPALGRRGEHDRSTKCCASRARRSRTSDGQGRHVRLPLRGATRPTASVQPRRARGRQRAPGALAAARAGPRCRSRSSRSPRTTPAAAHGSAFGRRRLGARRSRSSRASSRRCSTPASPSSRR